MYSFSRVAKYRFENKGRRSLPPRGTHTRTWRIQGGSTRGTTRVPATREGARGGGGRTTQLTGSAAPDGPRAARWPNQRIQAAERGHGSLPSTGCKHTGPFIFGAGTQVTRCRGGTMHGTRDERTSSAFPVAPVASAPSRRLAPFFPFVPSSSVRARSRRRRSSSAPTVSRVARTRTRSALSRVRCSCV